jgi:hypothetical protein
LGGSAEGHGYNGEQGQQKLFHEKKNKKKWKEWVLISWLFGWRRATSGGS